MTIAARTETQHGEIVTIELNPECTRRFAKTYAVKVDGRVWPRATNDAREAVQIATWVVMLREAAREGEGS